MNKMERINFKKIIKQDCFTGPLSHKILPVVSTYAKIIQELRKKGYKVNIENKILSITLDGPNHPTINFILTDSTINSFMYQLERRKKTWI